MIHIYIYILFFVAPDAVVTAVNATILAVAVLPVRTGLAAFAVISDDVIVSVVVIAVVAAAVFVGVVVFVQCLCCYSSSGCCCA